MKIFADETDKILIEVDRDEAHFLIDAIDEMPCNRCTSHHRSDCHVEDNYCARLTKQLREALGEDADEDNEEQ